MSAKPAPTAERHRPGAVALAALGAVTVSYATADGPARAGPGDGNDGDLAGAAYDGGVPAGSS